MSAGALAVCAAGVGLLLSFLIDRRRRQHEQLYVKRMQGSMLYYELYPLIALARKHDIDHVQVERSRIVIYSVCPPGKIGEYVLSEWGRRPLNPERTWALAQALALDLPILQETQQYRLRRYRVIRPNGQKDYGYQFMIRRGYKTELMQARQRPWLD